MFAAERERATAGNVVCSFFLPLSSSSQYYLTFSLSKTFITERKFAKLCVYKLRELCKRE